MKIRILASICYVWFTIGSFADSYTITLPAGESRLIANHLNHPGGNTLYNILPNPPPGTLFYTFTGAWNFYEFDPDDLVWYPDGGATLNPGEGAAIKVPVATTITFTGTPVVPVLPLDLSGDCTPKLRSRQTTDAPTTFEDLTGLSPTEGTRLFRLSLGSPTDPLTEPYWTVYTFFGGVWTPSTPTLNLGESAFISTNDSPCCNGGCFPSQGDDTTSSEGVFQITVDPSFRPLVEAAGALVAYTGYRSSDGTLTSPVCVDKATTIGRSTPNHRSYSFPVPIGSLSWDSISGYGDYPVIPALWADAAAPTKEVLTEIKSFVLQNVTAGCTDSRIPAVPLAWPMVHAGTFAGVSPRSLGMVQANGFTDFPARSFFDIFVNVNLPPLPGTVSAVAFPATGAVLYNDSPLIITNMNLMRFPPEVVYIHGGTAAVPLKFKVSNPPYWSAGEIFGYVVLAGHGTIANDCSTAKSPDPVITALLDATLGPAGTPAPGLPVEWLRTNTLCPSPGSAYNSMNGTNFGGQSLDVVSFTIPGQGTFYARNLSHGNFPDPITPPLLNDSATYSTPDTLMTFDLSVNGVNWSPASANGPLTTTMANTSAAGDTTSTFDTEMLSLTLTGTSPLGSFMLRESPTKQSLGKHSIRTEARGYRISSFFDVFLELSKDDGATWGAANRSIRVQASAPPAAPNSIFVTHTNGSVTLNWLGSFPLESAPAVTGPYSDVPGITTGPFTPVPTESQGYFRLRQ